MSATRTKMFIAALQAVVDEAQDLVICIDEAPGTDGRAKALEEVGVNHLEEQIELFDEAIADAIRQRDLYVKSWGLDLNCYGQSKAEHFNGEAPA